MRRGHVESLLTVVARRVGLEVGQTYTIALGLLAALVLGVLGLPPVLRAGGDVVFASAPSASDAPAPPTTVPGPVVLAPIGAPLDPSPTPAAGAAPPTSISFRPPPPANRSTTPSTTTTTRPAGPRAPIPSTPAGSTSVFARVPQPGAPAGVGVGPDGTVYVATDNAGGRGGLGPSEIIAFTPTGTLIGSFAITGQPADRTNGLTGLAVDPRGRVIVADSSTGRLLRLDPSRSELTELASVPDVPPCLVGLGAACEPGAIDHPADLRGLTLAPDGAVLVADHGQGLVWRYDSGEPTIHLAVERRSPGGGPTSVAVRGDELIVAVSGVADSLPPGQSSVLSVVDTTATALAVYDPAEGLAGVAVGRSGNIFVTLAGADAVEVLGPDGPLTRYDGGGVDPGFDAPTGLALGDGHLLVTSQSTVANDPDHWVVHRIVVTDGPSTRS